MFYAITQAYLPCTENVDIISFFAPVAQGIRALGYEPRGRGFKSCRARHTFTLPLHPGRHSVMVAQLICNQ